MEFKTNIIINEVPKVDISSISKKAFDDFRITSFDGHVKCCMFLVSHCIDIFTLGNDSINDSNMTFLGRHVNAPCSLSAK